MTRQGETYQTAIQPGGNPVLFIDPTGEGWIEVRIGSDRFVFYDPNVNSTQEAMKAYQYGHVVYLGNFYEFSFNGGGTDSRDISVKLSPNGGFSVNGKVWDGEYHGNNLYIGDISKVTFGLNYGYYTGPNNPTYKKDGHDVDSYITPPRSRLDYAAFRHDRAYDKKGARGPLDALFNLGVMEADAELAKSAARIYITTLNPIEKYWSERVLMLFGIIANAKYSFMILNH